jgi:hypothetical protein
VTQFNVSFIALFVLALKQEKLILLLLQLPDLRTLCHLEFILIYIYIYLFIYLFTGTKRLRIKIPKMFTNADVKQWNVSRTHLTQRETLKTMKRNVGRKDFEWQWLKILLNTVLRKIAAKCLWTKCFEHKTARSRCSSNCWAI